MLNQGFGGRIGEVVVLIDFLPGLRAKAFHDHADELKGVFAPAVVLNAVESPNALVLRAFGLLDLVLRVEGFGIQREVDA